MQGKEQAEGPTRHETGTATRNVEQASDGKSGSSMRGGACNTKPERDMYGGGAGPTGLTNIGGGDRGARLTVAEGVARHAPGKPPTSAAMMG